MKRIASFLLAIILIIGVLASVYIVQPVRAQEIIYIRADGSIEPSTVPINRDGDLYTLTGDITDYDGIVIERDDIVLDGANHLFDGCDRTFHNGITLENRENVTIKNMKITHFAWWCIHLNSSSNNFIQANDIVPDGRYDGALLLESSSNNLVSGNNVTGSYQYYDGICLSSSSNNNSIIENNIRWHDQAGVGLHSSSNNIIIGNNITDNGRYGGGGISLDFSYNNTISGNNIANNEGGIEYPNGGICLYASNNNSISENNVTDNEAGISLESSSNNKVYHNNFVDNAQQVDSLNSTNVWDDGYPSGGNYWSDYNGSDTYSGPYQNETGGDEIGDVPYAIDGDNADHYPLMNLYEAPASPRTWIVDDDGPADFHTIQEAINAAGDGDTIFVKAGTYYENVIINKKVSLVGEDRGTTIIDGSGNGNVVCMTSAAGTANISSFTLRNGRGINDGAGIDVQSSSNHTITGNIITDNQRGLRLQFSRYNVICDNEITSNIETGIELRSSHWNSIFRNTASGNGLNIWIIGSSVNSIAGNEVADGDWGICLTESFNNTLRNNNMNQNWFNFAVQGARVQDYIHDIDFSNFVNGKAVYYMVGKKNLVIDTSVYPEVGYIGIVNCENMTVKNLNLEANAEGIKLVNTTGSLITNLRINGVSAGISIEFGSCNNTVSKNVVLWCEMVGIYLRGSSCYNVIYENQVTCLNSGIRTLDSSDNNLVYHNTFFQYFPQQMSFGSTNTWDNGYPSGGNYWSDYTGSDLYLGEFQTEPGSDGMGDTSYVMDGSNTDHYPLMSPWTPPDVAVLNVTGAKRFIGEGYSASLTALVENQGNKVENLNVTVYVGETPVTFQTFLLKSGDSLNHTFPWNSTGFAKGNYTLIALIEPIEGEEDLADNTMYNDWVFISIPGDVNGDKKVNILDAIVLSDAIFSEPSEPNWNANADINNDGKVNILDCIILGNHMGQSWA